MSVLVEERTEGSASVFTPVLDSPDISGATWEPEAQPKRDPYPRFLARSLDPFPTGSSDARTNLFVDDDIWQAKLVSPGAFVGGQVAYKSGEAFEFALRLRERIENYFLTRAKLEERLSSLKAEGRAEGIELKESSEADFRTFIGSKMFFSPGSLFLEEDGTLRMIWRKSGEAHLALRFLGAGHCQYVIFRKRNDFEPVARVVGRDALWRVNSQIRAFDLADLIEG